MRLKFWRKPVTPPPDKEAAALIIKELFDNIQKQVYTKFVRKMESATPELIETITTEVRQSLSKDTANLTRLMGEWTKSGNAMLEIFRKNTEAITQLVGTDIKLYQQFSDTAEAIWANFKGLLAILDMTVREDIGKRCEEEAFIIKVTRGMADMDRATRENAPEVVIDNFKRRLGLYYQEATSSDRLDLYQLAVGRHKEEVERIKEEGI